MSMQLVCIIVARPVWSEWVSERVLDCFKLYSVFCAKSGCEGSCDRHLVINNRTETTVCKFFLGGVFSLFFFFFCLVGVVFHNYVILDQQSQLCYTVFSLKCVPSDSSQCGYLSFCKPWTRVFVECNAVNCSSLFVSMLLVNRVVVAIFLYLGCCSIISWAVLNLILCVQ